jgi:hypothetical protein
MSNRKVDSRKRSALADLVDRGWKRTQAREVLGLSPKTEKRRARPRRQVTQRQLEGLLFHRQVQRGHIDDAIEGIRKKLRAMGASGYGVLD